MVHSNFKVPKDIMVVNAKQLQTKIEKNASDILKLVDLIRELVRLIDRVPSSGKSATVGRSCEPLVKKLKVVLDDIHIPSPTLLNSIRPTIIDNISYE
ncbi:hypothetical protein Tco_1060438 [Tanacetum coccineum]